MSSNLIHGLQHVGMHLAKEVSKDPKKAAAAAVTGITVAGPYILAQLSIFRSASRLMSSL